MKLTLRKLKHRERRRGRETGRKERGERKIEEFPMESSEPLDAGPPVFGNIPRVLSYVKCEWCVCYLHLKKSRLILPLILDVFLGVFK